MILPFSCPVPKRAACTKWLTVQDTWQTDSRQTLVLAFFLSSIFLFFISHFSSFSFAYAWLATSIFHYSSNEARSDPPCYERHLIFHLPFLIAYLRVLKLAILIGKLKIWCASIFRGTPITANETLVKQIALKGRERVSGQFLPPAIPPAPPTPVCVVGFFLQLHPLPSHFCPRTFIASAAQDKQQ